VRMLLPPIDQRREMDKNLVAFFRDHRLMSFRRAIADFCRFYHLRRPRIGWFEYIDWGKTAGKTFEDGRIHMVHPENWKRGRVYKSERMWVQMVYHELAHYLFWTDAETKAETFTCRMVRGLKRAPKRARVASSKAARTVRASSTRSGATRTAGTRRIGASRTATARRTRPDRAGVGEIASAARTATRARRRKVVAAPRRVTRRARG
jgi:hypothetical protein